MTKSIELGNFSHLATHYSGNRPDYARNVLLAITGLFDSPIETKDVCDVGAGTGIWTRMLSTLNPNSLNAIEPNQEMRLKGQEDSNFEKIHWKDGSAENTGMGNLSVDWVTMASSFHWANFDLALKEFSRILRPNGFFTAVWNPRVVIGNPFFEEIENLLIELKPDLKRKSSGNSEFTEGLSSNLGNNLLFKNVIYMESTHTIRMSKERYISAWMSVNDVRFQLGENNFRTFIDKVKEKIQDIEHVDSIYKTRAWTVQKR
jgi:ubiquinone/menaquinone biosynthesis C-methylase UbiE